MFQIILSSFFISFVLFAKVVNNTYGTPIETTASCKMTKDYSELFTKVESDMLILINGVKSITENNHNINSNEKKCLDDSSKKILNAYNNIIRHCSTCGCIKMPNNNGWVCVGLERETISHEQLADMKKEASDCLKH